METGRQPLSATTTTVSTPTLPAGVKSDVQTGAAASEQTPLLPSAPESSSGSVSSPPYGGSQSTSCADDVASTTGLQISHLRILSISLSLWLLIFLEASNMSGMALIQGTIAAELQVYENSAMWFSSAYLITMSSLAPVAGRLANIFQPRLLIMLSAASLATGSALCAGAGSFPVFVTGRVVAGLGAAGLLALGVIIALELTSEKSRGLAMGCINAAYTIGVSFGAIVFGGLVPVIGWRSLFWIQVPFALTAGFGVYASLVDSPKSETESAASSKEKLARIDYLGALLLILSIVLFLYSLAVEVQFLLMGISLASFLLFLFVEFRIANDPMIPVKTLSSRGVLLSCLAQLGIMSARWSILFYAPIFMLAVRGNPAATAGSVLIPTNVAFALGGIIVGWLHIRRGGAFWLPSVISLLAFNASFFVLSCIAAPSKPVNLFIWTVVVNGFTMGAGVNYTLAHVLYLSHEDTRYVTTSLIVTFRGFGGSFGTAIGGGIFYRLLRSNLVSGFRHLDGRAELGDERKALISKLTGSPAMVYFGGLNSTDQIIAIDAYTGATRGVWQAAATLCIIMVCVQAATGWRAPRTGSETGGAGAVAASEEREVLEA